MTVHPHDYVGMTSSRQHGYDLWTFGGLKILCRTQPDVAIKTERALEPLTIVPKAEFLAVVGPEQVLVIFEQPLLNDVQLTTKQVSMMWARSFINSTPGVLMGTYAQSRAPR